MPKHKGEIASWAISGRYRGQVERLLHLTPAKTPTRCGRNASWEVPLTSLKSECAKLKHTSLCYSQPLTPAHWLLDSQLIPALLQSSQGFNNLFSLLQAEHVQDHCRGEGCCLSCACLGSRGPHFLLLQARHWIPLSMVSNEAVHYPHD